MEPLIITIATTGSATTRDHNPHLPLTPEEIADEVVCCWQAGASVAHIHVRDDQGRACMDLEKFRRTVGLVRQRCDIIVNLTTSGLSGASDEERMRPLVDLRPEMASFDAGSTNLGERVFANEPAFLVRLAKTMRGAGVKPEIEVFETGFIDNACALAAKGLLQAPLHFQFVLGAQGAISASARNLVHLVESLPAASTWSVVGLGKDQLPMATVAIVMGGHVRVGMEDNVYLRKGVPARSNADLVRQVVELAGLLQRPVASTNDARSILGLDPDPAR